MERSTLRRSVRSPRERLERRRSNWRATFVKSLCTDRPRWTPIWSARNISRRPVVTKTLNRQQKCLLANPAACPSIVSRWWMVTCKAKNIRKRSVEAKHLLHHLSLNRLLRRRNTTQPSYFATSAGDFARYFWIWGWLQAFENWMLRSKANVRTNGRPTYQSFACCGWTNSVRI